jgi:hypothetical protein
MVALHTGCKCKLFKEEIMEIRMPLGNERRMDCLSVRSRPQKANKRIPLKLPKRRK